MLQNIIEAILKSIDMGDLVLSLTKATPEIIQGRGLNSNSNYIVFSVSSNSLLLTENDLDSMFDPYQILETSNRKNLLRAMTLASVKNLVDAINGQIWVETQILKNTSFNIVIQQNEA